MSDFESSYSYYSNEGTWLEEFLAQEQFKEMLVEIPESYFRESLVLLGLEKLNYYEQALGLILNDTYFDDNFDEIKESATVLYALAHQRYVRTPEGLNDVYSMYQEAAFGKCPRIGCTANLLPYSSSNNPGDEYLMFYCPKCRTLFNIASEDHDFCIDGSFYGCDFLGMFICTFVGENENFLKPSEKKREIYGFEIVSPKIEEESSK